MFRPEPGADLTPERFERGRAECRITTTRALTWVCLKMTGSARTDTSRAFKRHGFICKRFKTAESVVCKSQYRIEFCSPFVLSVWGGNHSLSCLRDASFLCPVCRFSL